MKKNKFKFSEDNSRTSKKTKKYMSFLYREKKRELKKQREKEKNAKIFKIVTENLENKGKVIRRLNKLGIKTYKGKKTIMYKLEELQLLLENSI